MSCYFRHIKDILNEAGIKVTPGNKKQIDTIIHDIVGVTDKDCPATWQKLKREIAADGPKRQAFIEKLQHVR